MATGIFLASVLVIGLLLFVFMVLVKKRPNTIDAAYYRSEWLRISGGLADNEAAMKVSIMEADALVDRALRELGFAGDTMGERLKSASNALPHRNDVWTAHKLRNKLAHEPGTPLSSRQAEQAMRQLRKGLEDLRVL